MPLSRTQLIAAIKDLLDGQSEDPNVNPAEARTQLANGLGDLIANYVVGKTTVVTGTSATGGPVTGSGIIQE